MNGSEGQGSPAQVDSARLKEITGQLAADMRPLVDRVRPVVGSARPLLDRARPWADVLLPLQDELRPLFDDLRPVVQDLRALLGELLSRVRTAAERLDLGPVTTVGGALAASAGRLASIRPARAAGALPSLPQTMRAPQVSLAIPVPAVGSTAAVRRAAGRLRPGRWAFRTTAVGVIVLALSSPTFRDAAVEQVDWTRSVLQTIEIPALQLPTIELPSFELPSIELPTIELPTIQIPNIELPTFELPRQEPAAPPKLAQAQFELPPLNAYRATFETQALYPTVAPNTTVEWVVALRNTGSVGWYKGVAGAQAALALIDGTEVAVQTTPYVAPGQVGWFIVRFRAPAGPGTHAVPLLPRIDGRGELPDLGIYTLVTVR